MVRALVAGRDAGKLLAALRQAGFDPSPLEGGAGDLLVVLVGPDGESGGAGDAGSAGSPTGPSYADLVPAAPFTEWRDLVISLWPGGRNVGDGPERTMSLPFMKGWTWQVNLYVPGGSDSTPFTWWT